MRMLPLGLLVITFPGQGGAWLDVLTCASQCASCRVRCFVGLEANLASDNECFELMRIVGKQIRAPRRPVGTSWEQETLPMLSTSVF